MLLFIYLINGGTDCNTGYNTYCDCCKATYAKKVRRYFYDSNNILLERNTVGFGVYDIPKTLISNMIYFKITPMKESDEDKLKYINVYRYQKTRTIYLSLLSNNSFEVVKDNSIVNGTILNYQEEEGVKINTYQLMKKNI